MTKKLINNLSKHDLILYFTLHHKLLKYKNLFNNNDNIIYIEENDVSECLSKTNLLITDYSSIIFDMIYRSKPYIIYIPDGNDTIIKDIYRPRCYEVIKKFKSNEFKFENTYFDIKKALNKINHYINNNFQLESKLVKFYEHFNFKKEPSLKHFVSYLLEI